MNGRALGDRAIEVSPSSARILERAAEILTPFPVRRYPTKLIPSPAKIVPDLETGHVPPVASVISNVAQHVLDVLIHRPLPKLAKEKLVVFCTLTHHRCNPLRCRLILGRESANLLRPRVVQHCLELFSSALEIGDAAQRGADITISRRTSLVYVVGRVVRRQP